MQTRNPFNLSSIHIYKLLVFSVLLFSFISCSRNQTQESESSGKDKDQILPAGRDLKTVNFLPYWVANAQFAGYYVAAETGIYEKYGIKINIIPFEPFVTSTDLIREGKIDFAPLWLVNAIELKASGADIVNIAQPSSRSSLMLITKKKSGINTIEQMDGKKAGIWSGFDLQPKAMFSKYNLNVKIIPIGSTNNLFLMDGVDITIANWFDEYHSILNSGLSQDELNTFFFADYGLNFLEDGIYCPSTLLKRDPELCKNFVKATFEGWQRAFENPEEAIDIVVIHAAAAKMPVNRVHQKWMLDRYKDLYLIGKDTPFNTILSPDDYHSVGNILLESGLINEIPPYNEFYQPVL
jgi:NitT/TauT family transport system substrate-binding protein